MRTLLITLLNLLYKGGKVAVVLGIILILFGNFQKLRTVIYDISLIFRHLFRVHRGEEQMREAEAKIQEQTKGLPPKTFRVYYIGFWIAFVGGLVYVVSGLILSNFLLAPVGTGMML